VLANAPQILAPPDIAFIVVIVAFACVAAYLSVRLTRPKPSANAGFSVEWQCSKSLGILALSTRIAHQMSSRSAPKGGRAA
jgi:hypothetical protein